MGETLRELIQARKGRLIIADLVERSGGHPGHSRWQQYGSKDLRNTPEPDSIVGIAAALQVPVRRVWLSCGYSLGLPMDDPEMMDEVASPLLDRLGGMGTEKLSLAQVDYLVGITAELLDLIDRVRTEVPEVTPIRALKAARKTTGHEDRGPRGGRRAT